MTAAAQGLAAILGGAAAGTLTMIGAGCLVYGRRRCFAMIRARFDNTDTETPTREDHRP